MNKLQIRREAKNRLSKEAIQALHTTYNEPAATIGSVWLHIHMTPQGGSIVLRKLTGIDEVRTNDPYFRVRCEERTYMLEHESVRVDLPFRQRSQPFFSIVKEEDFLSAQNGEWWMHATPTYKTSRYFEKERILFDVVWDMACFDVVLSEQDLTIFLEDLFDCATIPSSYASFIE